MEDRRREDLERGAQVGEQLHVIEPVRERCRLVDSRLVGGESGLGAHLGDVANEQRRERLVERGALGGIVRDGRPPRHQFNARHGDGCGLCRHLVTLAQALHERIGHRREAVFRDHTAGEGLKAHRRNRRGLS